MKYIYWTNTGGYSTGSARVENGGLSFPDERYVDAKEIISIHAEIRQVDSAQSLQLILTAIEVAANIDDVRKAIH